jgi:hypothetical protein
MKNIQKTSNALAITSKSATDMTQDDFAGTKPSWAALKRKYAGVFQASPLLLCLFSSPGLAQNYYVCNNGSDSSFGSSPYEPLKTFDYAMTKFGRLNAGDAILFCRGGTFTSSYPRLFNQYCTPDAPCTIADYIPPNISPMDDHPSISDLPVITSSGANGVLNFQDGGPADHDEGYVVKNLSLKGNGSGNGIFLFNDVDYVTVEGVTIDGFSIGMYSAGANAPNPGANQVNEHIVLRNSTIINNKGQGWLGGCNDCLIHNNKFTNNGFERKIFNHNVYIGGNNNYGITVSNNTLYQSAIVEGKCYGVSLVVHGVVTDLTIKNNTVYEDLGAAHQTCWGISVDPGYASEESFSNVVIADNKVTNVGNVGIGCASCTDLRIIDNTITHSQDFGFFGIKVPVRTEDTVKSDRIEITGNYIELLDTNNRGKEGIVVNVTGDVNVGANEVIILE